MIDIFIKGVIDFSTFFISTLSAPIDGVISTYLPSVENAFQLATDFFSYILGFIPWILSWFNFPSFFLKFLFSSWSFVILVSLALHTIKLFIKWFHMIKL